MPRPTPSRRPPARTSRPPRGDRGVISPTQRHAQSGPQRRTAGSGPSLRPAACTSPDGSTMPRAPGHPFAQQHAQLEPQRRAADSGPLGRPAACTTRTATPYCGLRAIGPPSGMDEPTTVPRLEGHPSAQWQAQTQAATPYCGLRATRFTQRHGRARTAATCRGLGTIGPPSGVDGQGQRDGLPDHLPPSGVDGPGPWCHVADIGPPTGTREPGPQRHVADIGPPGGTREPGPWCRGADVGPVSGVR